MIPINAPVFQGVPSVPVPDAAAALGGPHSRDQEELPHAVLLTCEAHTRTVYFEPSSTVYVKMFAGILFCEIMKMLALRTFLLF